MSPHLLEANQSRPLSKALAAHVNTVLPYHTVSVEAHTAAAAAAAATAAATAAEEAGREGLSDCGEETKETQTICRGPCCCRALVYTADTAAISCSLRRYLRCTYTPEMQQQQKRDILTLKRRHENKNRDIRPHPTACKEG